jgi:hypothetical protein
MVYRLAQIRLSPNPPAISKIPHKLPVKTKIPPINIAAAGPVPALKLAIVFFTSFKYGEYERYLYLFILLRS